ncbi:MAG: hypothetical protein RL538_589 [Candidatus Parcubacteria bacterium]|jgi:hypothetical protein
MANHLHELRKKPKHVRDNVAFGIAGGMTFMIAIAWFTMWGAEMPNSPQEVAAEDSSTAFSTFFSQIKEQAAMVKDSFPLQGASSTDVVMPDIPDESAFKLASGTDPQLERVKKEAAIMIVSGTSSSTSTTTASSSSVLY